jgi:predicted outer membrane repeat protein
LWSGVLLEAQGGHCQTYVSGKVATANGKIVASGAVALEKGELHNNAFQAGGAIAADGTFKIPLPSGGPWGLHVYSEKYIYFPLQIQVREDQDNEVPVILPVDATAADDPHISSIRFNKISPKVIQVTMQVTDPNHNLGPQMLAIDTNRFKAYRLLPRDGDLKNWKASFPEGEYVSPDIPLGKAAVDPGAWLFVVADHQCSNGVVQNGLGQSIFKPPVAAAVSLSCELAGIWKSNFDKLYRFSALKPGRYKGEQFEGELTIDQMLQNDREVAVDYHYAGQKGSASLHLTCGPPQVELRGTYKLPDRSGEWSFIKIQNAKADPAQQGRTLFINNCANCHYTDSEDYKVGPGLKGLSQRESLPATGLPVNKENLRKRIVDGGEIMPAFNHLKEDEVTALIGFLLSL